MNGRSSALRLAELANWLVDAKIGIVERAELVPRQAGEPEFFHVAARSADVRRLGHRHSNFRTTGGASVNPAIALAKALGEAVERYCVAFYDVEELPLASHRSFDHGHSALDPAELALYSPAQYAQPDFPWVPFTADTLVRWTEGYELTKRADVSPCWIPAALVHVPYFFYRDSGDSPICQPISTGLACGSSLAAATLSGLYEVIERDSFTLTWQGGISLPHIRVETLLDDAYDLVRRFERTGAQLTLLDATLDNGITTIIAVLRSDHPDAPALVVAAATDLNPANAVIKSLEELAHTRRYSQDVLRRSGPIEADAGYGSIVDQQHHLAFWANFRNRGLADFLFASRVREEFDSIVTRAPYLDRPLAAESDLDVVVRAVNATGHRALVVPLTTPDVASLGLNVVRVVIPGYHPLFMGHRIRALGGDRLWNVPGKLGYTAVKRSDGDTDVPHPFP